MGKAAADSQGEGDEIKLRLIYATPGRDKRGDTTVLDIYLRLAKHLEDLIMGYPFNEALTDLLKAIYSPV